MKTQLLIIKLEDWKFKNQQGQELSGQSATYLLEELELYKSSVKDDVLMQIQKATLPAIFEADIKIGQKFNDGKAKIKFDILSLKFVRSVKLFKE